MGHATLLVVGYGFRDQLHKFRRDVDDENGFIDWFEHTQNDWKLKPQGLGLVVDDDGREALSVDGYAGSAKKSAIDLDGMREPIHTSAGQWWDGVARATGSVAWKSFNSMWEPYSNLPYNQGVQLAVMKEWSEQPPVKAIFEASRTNKPFYDNVSHYEISDGSMSFNQSVCWSVDRLLLARDKYVELHGLQHLLSFNEVIWDGVIWEGRSEKELFESIPDNALLTLAVVHC